MAGVRVDLELLHGEDERMGGKAKPPKGVNIKKLYKEGSIIDAPISGANMIDTRGLA